MCDSDAVKRFHGLGGAMVDAIGKKPGLVLRSVLCHHPCGITLW